MAYEWVAARKERRKRAALYHSALVVDTGDGRYTIESTPTGASDGVDRGVVGEGPVGSRVLGRWRPFRYELRCWRDGVIPDLDMAVGDPARVSAEPGVATRVVELAECVPTPTWGRDELSAGEMWNSNSMVAWLLVRAGISVAGITPPCGGRAPGWDAGVRVARRGVERHPETRTER
ncbi:MAG: hypothetical protein U0R50_05645 [Gaiellales bacterium]